MANRRIAKFRVQWQEIEEENMERKRRKRRKMREKEDDEKEWRIGGS